jgi:hypothetical protein
VAVQKSRSRADWLGGDCFGKGDREPGITLGEFGDLSGPRRVELRPGCRIEQGGDPALRQWPQVEHVRVLSEVTEDTSVADCDQAQAASGRGGERAQALQMRIGHIIDHEHHPGVRLGHRRPHRCTVERVDVADDGGDLAQAVDVEGFEHDA